MLSVRLSGKSRSKPYLFLFRDPFLIHPPRCLSYVALDFEKEMQKFATAPSCDEKYYEYPDGSAVYIGNQRIRCAEALFQPSLLGIQSENVVDIVYKSIMQCDPSIRDELFGKIILTGGSSLFPGFADRVQKELEILSPATKIKISSAGKYSSWLGGSILASLPQQPMCITKEEYDESGPSIVNRMCF